MVSLFTQPVLPVTVATNCVELVSGPVLTTGVLAENPAGIDVQAIEPGITCCRYRFGRIVDEFE